MPTESSYPRLDVPNIDLWAFLFERKDREFPDDKSMPIVFFSESETIGLCPQLRWRDYASTLSFDPPHCKTTC
jgi:hypothetical protein